MGDLPAPCSSTDEILLALHGEIVGLRQDLAAARGGEAPQGSDGPVELREPLVPVSEPPAAEPEPRRGRRRNRSRT